MVWGSWQALQLASAPGCCPPGSAAAWGAWRENLAMSVMMSGPGMTCSLVPATLPPWQVPQVSVGLIPRSSSGPLGALWGW
jgi:hypothetical protein